MKHPSRRLSIVRIGMAAALVALAAPAAAQQDAVVATINGEPVTEADLELAIGDVDQLAQVPEAQRRAAALSALIEFRLISAEAEKQGLAEGDDFARRMALLRQRALHSAYIDREIASQVTEEAVRARYEREVAGLSLAEEVHARHIIVETQEEAAAIIAELDAGGDFEALARERSKDGAAAQGGDLGYFGPGQMVPEFEQAAFAMEAGAHSAAPVQTQFGWHVIKVEDKRAQQPPAFEQVADQLRSLLLRETYFATVSGLREAADIEIGDPALKEALEPAGQEDGEQE